MPPMRKHNRTGGFALSDKARMFLPSVAAAVILLVIG